MLCHSCEGLEGQKGSTVFSPSLPALKGLGRPRTVISRCILVHRGSLFPSLLPFLAYKRLDFPGSKDWLFIYPCYLEGRGILVLSFCWVTLRFIAYSSACFLETVLLSLSSRKAENYSASSLGWVCTVQVVNSDLKQQQHVADFLDSVADFYSSSAGWDFARSVEKESSSIFYSVMME